MFEKCEILNHDKEKFVFYAIESKISLWKLNKSNLEEKSAAILESSLIYTDVIQRDQGDFLFLICQNKDWIVLDTNFSTISQGKFATTVLFDMIKGCYWLDSYPQLILSFKKNFLVHFSLKYNKKYNGSYYQLPISDDVHWPSLSASVLDICLIKGSNSKDFAVINM